MMGKFFRTLYGRFRVWYADRALRRAGRTMMEKLAEFWEKNDGRTFYPYRYIESVKSDEDEDE